MLRHLALFAMLAPSAVFAEAPRPLIETSYDGIPFAYRSDLSADGNIEISGRMLDTRDDFRLVVKPSGRVVGRVGGNLVRFEIASKVRDQLFSDFVPRAAAVPSPTAIQSASLIADQR